MLYGPTSCLTHPHDNWLRVKWHAHADLAFNLPDNHIKNAAEHVFPFKSLLHQRPLHTCCTCEQATMNCRPLAQMKEHKLTRCIYLLVLIWKQYLKLRSEMLSGTHQVQLLIGYWYKGCDPKTALQSKTGVKHICIVQQVQLAKHLRVDSVELLLLFFQDEDFLVEEAVVGAPLAAAPHLPVLLPQLGCWFLQSGKLAFLLNHTGPMQEQLENCLQD